MDMVKKIYSILIEAQKILNNFDKNLADSDPNRKVEIQLDDVLSLGIVEVYNKYISLKSYDIEKNVAAPAEGDFQKLVLENAQDEIESTNEWVKNNISQLIKNKAKAISEAGSQGVKEAMNKLQGFIYSG